MIIKPIDSINMVGAGIINSSHSFSLHLKKNQRLDFTSFNDSIYFLASGTLSIYRISDNVLTITMESPALLGLTQMRNEHRYHYLRCDKESVVWGLEKNRAEILFEEKSLWKYSFDIVAYISNLYYHREIMTSPRKVKKIIIQHLYYISKMTQEEMSKTSIYSFILSRNNISRSAVHKVINELIGLELIAVSRGKLIKIDVESISHKFNMPFKD